MAEFRITVRFPEELGRMVKTYASENDTSLNEAVVELARLGLAVKHDKSFSFLLGDILKAVVRGEISGVVEALSVSIEEATEEITDVCLETKHIATAALMAAVEDQSIDTTHSEQLLERFDELAFRYETTGTLLSDMD